VIAQVGLTQPVSLQPGATQPARDRPKPTIKNWTWLGQRLVIPVGQVWPWLPADQAHLRQPLVEASEQPVTIQYKPGFLGLGRRYQVALPAGEGTRVRIYCHRFGYQWRWGRATWTLHHVRAPSGTFRAVLMRNRQPLAALQSQGRLLNRWTEIIYDGRGYRLVPAKRERGHRQLDQAVAPRPTADVYTLQDREGDTLLHIQEDSRFQVELARTLPLPLVVTALMQTIDQEPYRHTRKEEQK
jgi:hypothetical protein